MFLEPTLLNSQRLMSVLPTYSRSCWAVLTFRKDTTSFHACLAENGVTVDLRMAMNHSVFRGASFTIIDLNSEQQHLSLILAMPAVSNMWPVRRYHIPNLARMDTLPNPNGLIELLSEDEIIGIGNHYAPHVMTQVDQLHAQGCKFMYEPWSFLEEHSHCPCSWIHLVHLCEYVFTLAHHDFAGSGQGIRVGIVDTGVDYKHPALGGCFGKDCLVAYGYDLVGDSWNGLKNPIPDPDPYDGCIGHGTHVSGIIAAQTNTMNFTGIAPGVKLGMYKVFSCDSSATTDDVLISAFGRAFDDGSDVITASIGSLVGWSEAPWGKVVSRIVKVSLLLF